MFGFSYGEIFLLLGATAALIGPKDLPIIARTAGRFAGRAIGYVQLARGQFENVMEHSQARQVHKELQDTMAQLEAIRHEIRTISFMNPGSLTTRLVDSINTTTANSTADDGPQKSDKESIIVEKGPQISEKESTVATVTTEDYSSRKALTTNMHSQATAYARLAETTPLKSNSVDNEGLRELTDESGSIIVLPVSAESAGLLPKHKDEAKGSDIVLEAILEAEVANNAKEFFSQSPNQLKSE
ncbi:sec-independent protein translocase protein TatB isoform X1 [Capsicum galapagoense]